MIRMKMIIKISIVTRNLEINLVINKRDME